MNIERPDRRKAQFTYKNIEKLRFDKTIKEPMEWAFNKWGEDLYNVGVLKENEKEIIQWCDENDISLSAKNRVKLFKLETWQKQAYLIEISIKIMNEIGNHEFSNFNTLKAQIDQILKNQQIKLSNSEKKLILGSISWYDEGADKIIKSKLKLNGDKLNQILDKLGCVKDDLADFGYYETNEEDEFITYENFADLRDSENIPHKENIHDYFKKEVKPHLEDAWIDMNSVKIGYEISFNKYFYRHQPLRSIEEVGLEILELEQQSEGLIAEILGINSQKMSKDI